jgi:CubicO group peptidase (beta-lactamase class C family)
MSCQKRRALRAAGIKRALPFCTVASATLMLVSCGSLSSLFGPGDKTAAIVPSSDTTHVANLAGSSVSWPTHGWPTSTPEAQGIDSNVLADAMDSIRVRHIPVHSLLIERHGTIVLDAYFSPFADNETHNVASVTKSVTSTLVGIALGEHRLADLNTSVLSLLPNAGNPTDDPRKARVTLANLLSMTSGLDCGAEGGRNFLQQMEHSPHWASFALARSETAEPGSTFDYCAGNMHLVSAVLTQTTGTSAAEFARRELFQPLGIEHAVWPSDADGVSHGFSDLKLQPRDMAKLGYLWLHNGVWEGQQIVPASYLADALTAHANVEPGVQYGYGMWIYSGRGHAGGPADFEANGDGGQRIAVVPADDMVIVTTGSGLDANDVTSLIADAARSDTPISADQSGDARLERLIADASRGSVQRVAAKQTKPLSHIPVPKPAIRTAALLTP